jgi:Rad3-related DNA helicase
MAAQLRTVPGFGNNPRVLFHSQDAADKAETYARFRAATPEEGLILVGCGMREGIDLAYDAARWQVITKIPWPNLEEPAIRWQSIHQAEQYMWSCVRDLLQMSGRVVRAVDDTGATLILDSTLNRLLAPDWRHLLPDWYLEAIRSDYL